MNALRPLLSTQWVWDRVLDCGYSSLGDFLLELVSQLYPRHFQISLPQISIARGIHIPVRGIGKQGEAKFCGKREILAYH